VILLEARMPGIDGQRVIDRGLEKHRPTKA
jgi:hypothetical protein